MNPITGIAGCCARAASGATAAPPSRFVNDFVFANFKLTEHNWRDHIFPSPPPAK
jgi:hypothetical protein